MWRTSSRASEGVAIGATPTTGRACGRGTAGRSGRSIWILRRPTAPSSPARIGAVPIAVMCRPQAGHQDIKTGVDVVGKNVRRGRVGVPSRPGNVQPGMMRRVGDVGLRGKPLAKGQLACGLLTDSQLTEELEHVVTFQVRGASQL